MPRLILNPEVFQDPDMVGQSEYFAIFEILSNWVEQAQDEEETKKEIENHIKAIIEEFIGIARGMLKDLETQPAVIEEKEGEEGA